jgi:hypothetical protein
MSSGKAQGTPVLHGAGPTVSDRLASAVRIVPRSYGGPESEIDNELAHRTPTAESGVPSLWRGQYGQTPIGWSDTHDDYSAGMVSEHANESNV